MSLFRVRISRFAFSCLFYASVGVYAAVVIHRSGVRLCAAHWALLAAGLLLIDLPEDLVNLLGESFHGVLDFRRVVAFPDLLEGVDAPDRIERVDLKRVS